MRRGSERKKTEKRKLKREEEVKWMGLEEVSGEGKVVRKRKGKGKRKGLV